MTPPRTQHPEGWPLPHRRPLGPRQIHHPHRGKGQTPTDVVTPERAPPCRGGCWISRSPSRPVRRCGPWPRGPPRRQPLTAPRPPSLRATVPWRRHLLGRTVAPGSRPTFRPSSPAAGGKGGVHSLALALTSRPQQQPCASADPSLRPSAAARGCRAATVSERLAHPHNHGPTPGLSLGPEPSGLDCAQIHPSGRAPSVPRGQPARAQSALDRPGHAHCPQGPASGTVPSTGWLWKEDMHTVLLTGVSKGSAAPRAA